MSLLTRGGLIPLFILAFSSLTLGQQNNPFSLKWRQINTQNFKVLYPVGFDDQAQRMINTLEHIREPEAKSMGVKPRKISVLLQNQSSVSNGFVTLAPWRSEFYTMPPQDYNFIGTNDWLNLLAVHEYRHIVQFQRSLTGLNKWVNYLFGQQGIAVSSFIAAPQWFWEGDAVATETAFTNSGRGRIPYFNMVFRTNFLEGRTFNYHKQYLRSYKHNIPDHYVLGYNMISYLREKTGQPDIWEKIARRSWRMPFLPFAFSRAIRKETGTNVTGLYNEMAARLKKEWEEKSKEVQFTTFETINKRTNKAYTDFLYPQFLSDGNILVLKRGIGDIDQLVVLKDGVETERFVMGPVNSGGQITVSNLRVVWNEYRFDPRWQVRTYSVVRSYDFGTRKARQITRRSRYAGSAISPDGNKVATIENSTDYKSRLVILDYFSGKSIKSFENPGGDAITMPRWVDDKQLVVLRTSSNGKTISLIDTESESQKDLIERSDENIGYLVPFGDYIFYNSPYSGVDNIYVLDRQTGKKYQVTSGKYGSFNAAISPDGKWILYNNQTRDGMDVVKIPFDKSSWKPVEDIKQNADERSSHLAEQEGQPDLLDRIQFKQYESKSYNRLKGMFNPHSWGAYANSSLSAMNIGIASTDLLNTTRLEAGYVFDVSELTGAWGATLSYSGFYPIIDFSFSTGNRKSTRDYYDGNDVLQTADFRWNEQIIRSGIHLPFLLTKSKYSRELVLSDHVNYTTVSDFTNSDGNFRLRDQLGNGNLTTNELGIEFSNLLRRSRRDIQSKWGQRFLLKYTGALPVSDYYAGAASVAGYFFFPGLLKHHSVYLVGAYQNMLVSYSQSNYFLRNQIPKPRGGSSYPTDENFYFGSANYTLPVWYPDIAIGPFLNFQRVKANLFYDYGRGLINVRVSGSEIKRDVTYSSAGIEVRFDGNLMRLLQQFDIGFRYSYPIQNQTSSFELIIGSFGF